MNVAVLRRWLDGDDFKLARRAWLVVEESSGRLETELAVATGMKSRVVQGVVQSYRQLGLMGLLDAPRKGRPPKSKAASLIEDARRSSAQEAATTQNVSVDVVWRQARVAGISIERGNGRNRPVPPCRAMPKVVAVYSGDTSAVVLLADASINPESLLSMGSCHSTEGRSGSPLPAEASQNWLDALRQLRGRPGFTPARAQREAQQWFVLRVEKLLATGAEITIVVGGDPTSSGYLWWLGTFRSLLVKQPTSKPVLKLVCAAVEEDWEQALARRGVPRDPARRAWPEANGRPFAWCINVRRTAAADAR
jgi:transposase